MNRIITYLLFFLVGINVMAQVNVSGTVVDKENHEPLAGASVLSRAMTERLRNTVFQRKTGHLR